MRFKQLAIAITLASISTAALAENTGFYVGGKLGASIMQSKDIQSRGYDRTNTDYDYILLGNKNKAVFNMGVNAGYDFNVSYQLPIRAELDYTYRSDAKISTSEYVFSSIAGNAGGAYSDEDANLKIGQSTLMVNGYYDFYNSTDFTPYVGAGLGMSFIKYKDEYTNVSKTQLAWSAMAGVSYKVMPDLTASLEYRYLDSGKVKDNENDGDWQDKHSAKLNSNDISIGLRYAF
ncbi:outer membrane beta-barrel protein [Orbus sturtevantii]|uniref:outer membrane protein n=1 Tax=Orbus sturtevantii TaxID=3074109 RepID=UPI00370D30B0